MITKRQSEILKYIKSYSNKKGYAPSLKEIKKHFKLKSESTIHQHLNTLVEKGYLKKEKNQPRGVAVVADIEDSSDEMAIVDVVSDTKEPVKKKRKLVNKMNNLTASEWIPETISVYVQKGLGAGSEEAKLERQHPAPYSFQDVSRLIKFFTKKGETVLDPFCGIGSTLRACSVDDRNGIGIEIVKKYVDLTKERLKLELKSDSLEIVNKNQKIIHGDALKKVAKMEEDSIDFLVTSPPYWNILKKADHKVKQERIAKKLDTKYSELDKDLGNIDDYNDFIDTLSSFFNSCSRILRPKKYMAIVVSDFRNKDRYYKFHSDLSERLENENFKLKGITILYQRHKKIFPYGYPYSYVPNIHHQYILILQNNKI